MKAGINSAVRHRASSTSIIASRMCSRWLAFSRTSLGNMQPSQQMCLMPRCGGVLEPVAGALGDVELAVGIVGRAVAAGFVVGAGAVHGAVVLGDVEVDGPGAQGVGHGVVGGVRIRPSRVAFLEQGVLRARCSPAGRDRCGPGRPGSRRSRACRSLRAVSSMAFHECMPPQQISPSAARRSPWSSATLPASRKVSAIFLVLPAGSLAQSADAAGGVDADDAVLADAVFVEDAWRCGRPFRTGEHEVLAVLGSAHGASRRPCRARPGRRASRPRGRARRSCRRCALMVVVARRRDRCAGGTGTGPRRRTSGRSPRRRR